MSTKLLYAFLSYGGTVLDVEKKKHLAAMATQKKTAPSPFCQGQEVKTKVNRLTASGVAKRRRRQNKASLREGVAKTRRRQDWASPREASTVLLIDTRG